LVSDSYLQPIPDDPEYVPTPEQIERAVALLRSAYPDEPEITVADDIELAHPMENMGAIACPGCREELTEEWWWEAHDRAMATKYHDLSVTTPCCGLQTSLNDLQYEGTLGFYRFCIEYQNPERDPSTEIGLGLEGLLGCSLRKIWVYC
jgi:hypothetical protein